MGECPRRGIIFILSAPSGAGKTTLRREALSKIKGLAASVTLTTRPPREGEKEGIDHFFVSEEEFRRKLDSGELAEWARVFGHSYGTPRHPVESAIAEGRDVLAEIDIEGARQLRGHYGRDAVTIFVLPPTFTELEDRLRRRGTEDARDVESRLQRAREEAKTLPEYDYLIVNQDLRQSLSDLDAIVSAERLKVARLRDGFSPWKS